MPTLGGPFMHSYPTGFRFTKATAFMTGQPGNYDMLKAGPAGDVDGDRYADFWMASPLYSDGTMMEGRKRYPRIPAGRA